MSKAAIFALSAAWTLIASYFVIVGLFGAADTSCDGGTPRVDMEGGWLVIITVTLWASPVILYAAFRRSRVSVIAAVIVGAVALAIVVRLFASPGEFCF